MSTTWSGAGWAMSQISPTCQKGSPSLGVQLGPGEGVLGRGVAGAHRRLTGRQVVGMARLEAVVVALGLWQTTRCGRTARITRTISRCSSKVGSTQPSRKPASQRTSITPYAAHAASCSASAGPGSS